MLQDRWPPGRAPGRLSAVSLQDGPPGRAPGRLSAVSLQDTHQAARRPRLQKFAQKASTRASLSLQIWAAWAPDESEAALRDAVYLPFDLLPDRSRNRIGFRACPRCRRRPFILRTLCWIVRKHRGRYD